MESVDFETKLEAIAVDYEHSSNLAGVLEELQVSVLLSTYQAGKMAVLGTHAKRLTFDFQSFDQVMGLAVGRDQIAVGSRRHVHFLNSAHDVASSVPPEKTYDGCYIARTSFVTGSIHGHDLAFGTEGLWVVNTLFSCLCTLDRDYNFHPRWRPPFVSELIDQDRCHLNGLAMMDGLPSFVTVLGISDEPAGWRSNKRSGGAILDVASGQVVSDGLCMPHSPRFHLGKLWVLNSGCGELAIVDLQTGRLNVVAKLPGYTRGLAFCGNYAFVGLSRIRETNVFGGLPIGEHPERLQCGLAIVEITTGRTVANLRFKTGIEELFAVETISGCLNPKISGVLSATGDEKEIWVVPPIQTHVLSRTDPSSQVIDTLFQQADNAQQSGDYRSALQFLETASAICPKSVHVLNRLGNLHQDLNDKKRAVDFYQRALLVEPRFAIAHKNLGVLFEANNEPLKSLYHFEKAHESAPDPMNAVLAAKVLPIIYGSNDQVQYWRKRLSDCIDALVADGITIDTTNSPVPTTFHFAYQGQNDRHLMEKLARVYKGVDLCGGARDAVTRPHQKRLRIGFASAYFCQHTIGLLNVGLVEKLSRDRFEVFVIALRNQADDYSNRFRAAADHYVEVQRQPSKARKAIADLNLDVLIFCDIGMDYLSQTLCYSRMAPIQAVTWGHPDTTGSPRIDYFVSPDVAEPEDAQEHYSETLVRLPSFGVHYNRPMLSGAIRQRDDFGLDPKRRLYLCPQTLFKFHPEFDPPLRRILESDPGGDLVILRGTTESWLESLMNRWGSELPDLRHRIKVLPQLTRPDFLQLVSLADVMLDPFPFCGGNTSYEALALGTPIVTLPGRFLRGRLTHGLYERIGINSLTAQNVDDYVNIAVSLATDRTSLLETRRAISEHSGVLFDNLEDITSWEEAILRWIG